MNAARRSARRKNWPAHLYEPRPGYYVFRGPDGKTLALGAIPLAHAIHQVQQANAYIMAQAPSLVDRLSGQTNTIADVLLKMPKAEALNTIKAQKSQDGMIRAALGNRTCLELTVAHCAESESSVVIVTQVEFSSYQRFPKLTPSSVKCSTRFSHLR